MPSVTRAAVLVLASTPLLAHCMPDFDALSAGAGSSAGTTFGGEATGGDHSSLAGSSPSGGTSSVAGSLNGGTPSGGAAGAGAASGTAGQGGDGGGGQADGGAGGDAGASDGGAAGDGQTSCGPPEEGVTNYSNFDEGLSGPGFANQGPSVAIATTKGTTGSWERDPDVGNACPGALHFSFAFKGYASGSDADEVANGNYYFAPVNWTSAAAVHAMVKVSPANAAITGVRFYVVSGAQYLYYYVFDTTAFKTGEWNEMVLSPSAGPYYDPTSVRQLGVEVRLLRAGTSGIPAQPPLVEVWFDDIWLEPK
jgi:hypothetical protein